MSVQSVAHDVLSFLPKKPVVVEVSAGRLTSDAGWLVLREFDERIGLSARFAAALSDSRDQRYTSHSTRSLLRQRLYGILAGYDDQNDHDRLRFDPALQLVCDRAPDDEATLAAQPTMSRFENGVDIPSLYRLRDALIEQYLDSHHEPPTRITLDVDAFDDPAHGQQQLTLFHGYYGQNQYIPILWTEATTGMALLCGLRFGTAHASLGADDDLEYLVGKIRERWPAVDIEVRGDSGFGMPHMYEACERLGVWYTFGYAMNAVLKRETEGLQTEALTRYEATGQKQRLFTGRWYRAGSWPHARYVIVKAEAHAVGINRRAIVTNRPGGPILPEATYDEYVLRGESENRNKELKCDLGGDRLSDHRFMANFFRLYLHAAALNLIIRLRNELPDPPEQGAIDEAARDTKNRLPKTTPKTPLPSDGSELRRRTPVTWQMRLIKVAAEVRVSARRVLVRLSSTWPYVSTFRGVLSVVQRC